MKTDLADYFATLLHINLSTRRQLPEDYSL